MAVVVQSVFVVPAVVEVAVRQGYFDDAGLQVVTCTVASSHEQERQLRDGAADVAVTASDNLFAWNSAGPGPTDGAPEFVLVAQIETTTDLALLLRPGLDTLSAVSRVTLAVDAPGNGFAVVAYALMEQLGIAADRYDVVEVGGVRERFTALRDGTADATLVAPPLDEMGRSVGMTVATRVGRLTDDYPGLGIVARRATLDADPTGVRTYLGALDRARSWLRDAPGAEVRALLADAGMGPDSIRSVLAFVPGSLRPDVRGLEVLARLRTELAMEIPGAPAPHHLIDTRARPSAGGSSTADRR